MPEEGIAPKAVVEGPPTRKCPILLRQTSFKALEEAVSFIGADGTWQSRTAGDHVPVVDWPVPGRQPVLPLTLSSTQPTEHLLRIEHAFATSVPMMLTNEHQVLMRERVVTMGLGIYFGITLLGCVMALAAAVWMRDLASALLVPPTLLLGLSAASFAGNHREPADPSDTSRFDRDLHQNARAETKARSEWIAPGKATVNGR